MALEKSPSLSLELASVRTVLSTLGSPGSQGESPASTYGGTMTTSSISPTPRGDNSEEDVAHVARGMHTMNIHCSPVFHESRRSSPITVIEGQKPSQGDHQMVGEFVLHRHDNNHDNPFDDDGSEIFSIRHPPTPHRGHGSAPGGQVQDTPTRISSSRSGDELARTLGQAQESAGRNRTTFGGPGHEFEVITAYNAQALLPPRACIFVANLAQDRTDEELTASVTEAFQQYGRVYVKIRRDQRQMPFAFAQFENAEHAHQALMQGKGLVIDGRPCRTEPSKANRSVYLSKLLGGPVEESEARSALQHYGNIEEVWLPSPTEREVYGLAQGIFVKFEYQQDRRKALAGMRDGIMYHLEDPGVHSQDGRLTLIRKARNLMQPGQGLPVTPTRRPFHGGPTNLRAIVVMNISPTTNYEELSARFVQYGMILSIDSVNKPSIQGPPTIFAIIEYGREDAAQEAITHENGTTLQGNTIRVELSDSMLQLRRRFSPTQNTPSRFQRFGPPVQFPRTPFKNTMRTPLHQGFNGYATSPFGTPGMNAYQSPAFSTPGSVFSPGSSDVPNGVPLGLHFGHGHQQYSPSNGAPVGNAARMAMHPPFQAMANVPFSSPGMSFPAYYPYPIQPGMMQPHPVVYMPPTFAPAIPQTAQIQESPARVQSEAS